MGYWETSSGERYMVNIDQRLIRAMKDAGARFCWFKDNPGIDDETNEIFYEEKEYDGEKSSVLREGITVTAENGENITGYISHWVTNANNKTAGTNIKNWFIFQPGTYPTSYIISDNP